MWPNIKQNILLWHASWWKRVYMADGLMGDDRSERMVVGKSGCEMDKLSKMISLCVCEYCCLRCFGKSNRNLRIKFVITMAFRSIATEKRTYPHKTIAKEIYQVSLYLYKYNELTLSAIFAEWTVYFECVVCNRTAGNIFRLRIKCQINRFIYTLGSNGKPEYSQ